MADHPTLDPDCPNCNGTGTAAQSPGQPADGIYECECVAAQPTPDRPLSYQMREALKVVAETGDTFVSNRLTANSIPTSSAQGLRRRGLVLIRGYGPNAKAFITELGRIEANRHESRLVVADHPTPDPASDPIRHQPTNRPIYAECPACGAAEGDWCAADGPIRHMFPIHRGRQRIEADRG